MTTREQLKRAVGIDRSDAGRGVTADPTPSLPERLYAARERKGVDLYRAERDTKIRARYLGALERGDYKELPGAVYTKGFLRNYALYLGLDPEDVLAQWRQERGDGKEQPPAIVVPRPISAPRKGMTFSPGIVVAALLTVVIVAFGAYLGIQVLRFTKPPTIAVTQPATAVVDVDESTTTYTLEGTTLPGATVSIATPGREPYQVTATSDGDVGGRRRPPPRAQPVRRHVARSRDRQALRGDRQRLHHGAVPRDRGADADRRPAGGRCVVRERRDPGRRKGHERGHGRRQRHVRRSVRAHPAAARRHRPHRPLPPSVTAKVGDDGTYSTPYELTAGKWTITVTASGPDGKTAALTRNVTVGYKGVNLVVDGQGRPGLGQGLGRRQARPERRARPGTVIANGKTLKFTGKRSVEVRTGSSGVTQFTLNGTSLGSLGKSGVPETWLFAPPKAPEKTQRR